MQAYETGLKRNDTRMVLRPDSEFFRFFVDSVGQAAAWRAGGAEAVSCATGARRIRFARSQRDNSETSSGRLWSDEVHSVRRLPGRRRSRVRARRHCCSRPFPACMRRAMKSALATPDNILRAVGIVSAVVGLILIWLVRRLDGRTAAVREIVPDQRDREPHDAGFSPESSALKCLRRGPVRAQCRADIRSRFARRDSI